MALPKAYCPECIASVQYIYTVCMLQHGSEVYCQARHEFRCPGLETQLHMFNLKRARVLLQDVM